MIPKIIHHCWFGQSPKPHYVEACLATWRKHLRDYDFMEWNETNTSFEHSFVIKAFKEKRWAFVSDFVRVQKLKEHGGIYLDTDMFFLKSMPVHFLQYEAFVGAENRQSLSAGVIGTIPNGRFINAVFEFYATCEVVKFEDVIIPGVINNSIAGIVRPIIGPQENRWALILHAPVFYPLPLKLKKYHWRKFITEETIAVHLWAGSWLAANNVSSFKRMVEKMKYGISKWYVPKSFIEYARNY